MDRSICSRRRGVQAKPRPSQSRGSSRTLRRSRKPRTPWPEPFRQVGEAAGCFHAHLCEAFFRIPSSGGSVPNSSAAAGRDSVRPFGSQAALRSSCHALPAITVVRASQASQAVVASCPSSPPMPAGIKMQSQGCSLAASAPGPPASQASQAAGASCAPSPPMPAGTKLQSPRCSLAAPVSGPHAP